MNERDLLAEASAALRDEHWPVDPAATRTRVLASLVQRRERRSVRMWLAALVMGLLVGSTAMAFWTGALATWLEARSGVARVPSVRVAPPRTNAELAPGPAPAPLAHEPARAAESSATTAVRAARHAADHAKPASDSREQALYEAAHHAHFVLGDAQQALAAWDAYLSQLPNGRFALEARYNRALCLVRLQRLHEAQAALEPFARGEYGNYRRKEASALLARVARRFAAGPDAGRAVDAIR